MKLLTLTVLSIVFICTNAFQAKADFRSGSLDSQIEDILSKLNGVAKAKGRTQDRQIENFRTSLRDLVRYLDRKQIQTPLEREVIKHVKVAYGTLLSSLDPTKQQDSLGQTWQQVYGPAQTLERTLMEIQNGVYRNQSQIALLRTRLIGGTTEGNFVQKYTTLIDEKIQMQRNIAERSTGKSEFVQTSARKNIIRIEKEKRLLYQRRKHWQRKLRHNPVFKRMVKMSSNSQAPNELEVGKAIRQRFMQQQPKTSRPTVTHR